MTVDKLRFNLGNTNYDVPTKEYVDSCINASGNSSTRGDIYKMIIQLLRRGGDNASFTSSYVTIQYTKTIN